MNKIENYRDYTYELSDYKEDIINNDENCDNINISDIKYDDNMNSDNRLKLLLEEAKIFVEDENRVNNDIDSSNSFMLTQHQYDAINN